MTLLDAPVSYTQTKRHDVLVYDGTPAGIAAVVQAARGGIKVVLIKKDIIRW